MFPGSNIVRVGSPEWKPRHTDILEELLDKVRSFLRTRLEMPFEQLRHEFESADMRMLVGQKYAYILYGPAPLFISNGQLQTDIKGLVFKARTHITKEGNLVLDL